MTGMTEFIEGRKAGWDRLSVLLAKVGNGGLRELSPDDLRSIGPLYRRATADLAYARLRGADDSVISYLNNLVTRTHGLLYSEKNPGSLRLWNFYGVGFPRLVRKHRGILFAAMAMFALGALLAGGLVAANPANVRAVVPQQFVDNDTYYKERQDNPAYGAPDEDKPVFSAMLMQNNLRVGILSFAVGILGGFPTLLIMISNGMPLGALAMQQHQAGRDLLFWSLILPHGVFEITGIIIEGAAGMLIGRALIAPRELSRQDAVALAGRDAVRLLLGTVPLTLAAGVIESFITPTNLPPYAKLLFAAFTVVLLVAYFNAGKPRDDSEGALAPISPVRTAA